MVHIIGVGGHKEHGKTTLANLMKEQCNSLGFDVCVADMSDPLRDTLIRLNPFIDGTTRATENTNSMEYARVCTIFHDGRLGFFTDSDLATRTLNPYTDGTKRYSELVNEVGYTESKKHPEVRRLLRALGTDVVRNLVHPDTWLNIHAQNFKNYHKNYAHNKNKRYPNGAVVILAGIRFPNELAMCDTSIYVYRPTVDNTVEHMSDNSLTSEDFDRTIINENIQTLREQAKTLISSINIEG